MKFLNFLFMMNISQRIFGKEKFKRVSQYLSAIFLRSASGWQYFLLNTHIASQKIMI